MAGKTLNTFLPKFRFGLMFKVLGSLVAGAIIFGTINCWTPSPYSDIAWIMMMLCSAGLGVFGPLYGLVLLYWLVAKIMAPLLEF